MCFSEKCKHVHFVIFKAISIPLVLFAGLIATTYQISVDAIDDATGSPKPRCLPDLSSTPVPPEMKCPDWGALNYLGKQELISKLDISEPIWIYPGLIIVLTGLVVAFDLFVLTQIGTDKQLTPNTIIKKDFDKIWLPFQRIVDYSESSDFSWLVKTISVCILFVPILLCFLAFTFLILVFTVIFGPFVFYLKLMGNFRIASILESICAPVFLSRYILLGITLGYLFLFIIMALALAGIEAMQEIFLSYYYLDPEFDCLCVYPWTPLKGLVQCVLVLLVALKSGLLSKNLWDMTRDHKRGFHLLSVTYSVPIEFVHEKAGWKVSDYIFEERDNAKRVLFGRLV